MKRTFGLFSLLAVVMAGTAGCGQMPFLADAPETTLEATSYDVEREILRALRNRYPDRSVTLESVRNAGYMDNYEFTASVAGRRVTGSYDSYSGRLTIRDEYQPDPGNDVTVRRDLRRALEDRFPRAYVEVTELRRSEYRNEYRFSARVDDRRVYGTFNAVTGRVTLDRDDHDPNPPHNGGELAMARDAIMSYLQSRFPFQSVRGLNMEAPHGTLYRFSVMIKDEQRFGYYDSTSRSVRLF